MWEMQAHIMLNRFLPSVSNMLIEIYFEYSREYVIFFKASRPRLLVSYDRSKSKFIFFPYTIASAIVLNFVLLREQNQVIHFCFPLISSRVSESHNHPHKVSMWLLPGCAKPPAAHLLMSSLRCIAKN